MTRILVDLSHAADGYVGIAQDIRLIFAMLAGIPEVEASGLLMPAGRHDLPHLYPGNSDAPALTAAVLHAMQRNWAPPERRPFPLNVIQATASLRQLLRKKHALLELPHMQRDALWRILFARTLPPDLREIVLNRDFHATDLSVAYLIDRIVNTPVPLPKYLDARGFDAVLFSMPRPVRLPPGVRAFIRFHDAVPVTDVDTMQTWKMGLAHTRLVRACAPDAIFICNSPQSLAALLTLDPRREKTAIVIPCAIAPVSPAAAGLDAGSIIARHLSFRALGLAASPPGWAAPAAGLRYVLSVSTLEPRKNFPGLIRGWERAAAADRALHLVIVGGPGWHEEETLAQMRPGVASGRILHVQNLPPDELHALMRGAACFAFPSFSEGFGLTPLEAMACGAPCVVSDLPVFRWIFGPAVLYADPYDPASIAEGITRLTAATEAAAGLRQALRAGAAGVLERFTMATVSSAWADAARNLGGGWSG